ncbi:phosphate signaling complex protein PhoU [Allochromatium humboldtianum]|uniref:Phosphate-specific transport system accessory protein PhoU n=1 Tax=Allochromatium humboldtianum TaxID=504901 RepID=A0A850R1F6_9GAMM|nr:phosphate signaling complex protein PhoU [Allochromatium humboldtianum]NVZ08449.1 phosphate signaling complex protein PhoU [Allochromatium humboldtianum]
MPESLNLVQKRRSHLQGAVGDLGARVVEALHRSVECLKTQDKALAADIIAGDQLINQQRRLLEQECLVTLAAYKPAGEDLRAVGACMELASELERIGDYAADVARILERDVQAPLPAEPVAAIAELAEDAIDMLEQTLAAFVANGSEATLRAAVEKESEVDREEDEFIAQVLERMRADAAFAATGTYLLWIVHNYERVADRATNVAERAIYVASGHTPDLD